MIFSKLSGRFLAIITEQEHPPYLSYRTWTGGVGVILDWPAISGEFFLVQPD